MDKQYFIKLLKKYQLGKASKEERKFLESYYDLFQIEPEQQHTLNNEGKKQLQEKLNERIWKNILRKEDGRAIIRRMNISFTRVAAAAVILIMISGFYFLLHKEKESHSPIAKNENRTRNVIRAQISQHEKENRVIFLPDGSTVFLSPGSRLNYPSTFDGMKKREVYLQGQAFFDIKHNVERPFIVNTGKVKTTVLGTAFNINAEIGESKITVTVARGRVRVSDPHKTLGIITPQEQITYNTKEETSTLTRVTDETYLSWKNADLFIDNLTLAEAAKLLEEQYDIRIIIKDSSVREQRFTATFPKNEKLEEAVKSISEFNGLSYKIDGDESLVTIYNSKQNK